MQVELEEQVSALGMVWLRSLEISASFPETQQCYTSGYGKALSRHVMAQTDCSAFVGGLHHKPLLVISVPCTLP